MNNSIYSNIKESKTGDLLPFFTDGKSMDSFYNPVKEAESIILQLEKSYNFFKYIIVAILYWCIY
mgnify:CR=1 FL=1